MIISRVGSLKGSLVGSAVGSIADDEGLSSPFAGITVDSGLGWRLPNNASEWTLLKSATGGSWALPDHLWLMQEASGNPADTIGTGLGTRNLTATGGAATPLYQQTVAGASRKFITGPGTAVNCNLANATMVDTSIRSFAWLGVVRSDTATVLRNVVIYGTPTFQQPASAKWRLRLGGSLVDTTANHTGAIHLASVVYDITAGTITMYTELEKLTVAFAASASTNMTFQLSSTGDSTFAYFGYSTAWDQSAAETLTSAQVKNLMEGILGTTVPWS